LPARSKAWAAWPSSASRTRGGGEVPRAVITVRGGYTLTKEEVRAHLEGRLARYKIPKSVVIVDELPRTASGKIRKADLRQMYAES
jgi:fatty-acyl-CoA synthase